MDRAIKVGIIGDFNPGLGFHNATNEALKHAAKALSSGVDFKWLPTNSLEDQSEQRKLEQLFRPGETVAFEMHVRGQTAVGTNELTYA